ncbi:MAG: AAA family ATPase [Geobacter sp.]|nr:MAG: AAA family ATPase [Geobacter sp.]
MTTEDTHISRLLPETREVLNANAAERIEYLKTDKWIPYPRANQILGKLEDLFNEPVQLRVSSLLIVGDSNNGKSSVVKKFERDHPKTDGMDCAAYPVMYVQAPPVPDERRFYDEIFSTLMVPFRHRDDPSQKIDMIDYYFNKLGTRMLIVDEIHNVLCGSVPKQRAFMNALKNLGNRMKMPLVLVGTKEALAATNTDTQISSRFRPMGLPLWKLDADFARLLASIETILPLHRPSMLATPEVATAVFELSEGNIGEIFALVNDAAMVAVDSGSEQLTIKEIKACGFVAPSKRRMAAELELA